MILSKTTVTNNFFLQNLIKKKTLISKNKNSGSNLFLLNRNLNSNLKVLFFKLYYI